MSNDTRDIFSGLKARKPQYVLGTKERGYTHIKRDRGKKILMP